jgi:hypothetical protein
MRTIDSMGIALGLAAALVLSHPGGQPAPDDLAAETFLLEQDIASLLHAMSSPAQACYAMAMATGPDDISPLVGADTGSMLAANCDPTAIAQLG